MRLYAVLSLLVFNVIYVSAQERGRRILKMRRVRKLEERASKISLARKNGVGGALFKTNDIDVHEQYGLHHNRILYEVPEDELASL